MEHKDNSTVKIDDNNNKIETNVNMKKHKKFTKLDKAIIGIGSTIGVLLVGSLGTLICNQQVQLAYGVKLPDNKIIEAYNLRFEQYSGKNKSASDVRSLIHMVLMNNSNPNQVDNYGRIILKGINSIDKIKDSKYYTVVTEVGQNDPQAKTFGYVDTITITEQTNYITE